MFLRFDKLPVCLSSQGVKFVKTAMQTISLVADAVLAVRAPDEGMISIATRELSMTLGRHSLEKLAGLRIEAVGGVFVFPSDSQSLQFTVTAKGYIDTQVSMLIKVFSESSYERIRHAIDCGGGGVSQEKFLVRGLGHQLDFS